MEVLLKKDDRDEENADDDYSYVLEKPLPAQGPG